MNEAERTLDLRARKEIGVTVSIGAFALTAVIFLSRGWNFALGLLVALVAAAAFGWISYRFLWVGVVLAALVEFVLAAM